MTPMIDVVFNLLVFCIYALVLMVRVDLLPMELRTFSAGKEAKPAPAMTISVDLDGAIYLDRVRIAEEDIVPKLEAAKAKEPRTVVYIALSDGAGTVDRAPLLQDLWDRLRGLDMPVSLVGKPSERARSPASSPARPRAASPLDGVQP